MRFDLPELHQGLLDGEALAAFVLDVELHTEVLEVRVKHGPERFADPAPVVLRAAFLQLVDGLIQGFQARYLWEGAEWRDAVIAAPGGYRIVRMRVP
jgi:hypothetical protein